MAANNEEKISSYIDLQAVGKETDVFTKQLNNIFELYKKINATKITVEGAKSFEAVQKAAKVLKTDVDELTVAQKKYEKSISDNNVALQGFRIQTAEGNKAAKEQAKEALGLVDAYSKLEKEYIAAQREAKNLAVEFGIDSKQAKEAAVTALKLSDSLKAIDNSVGQNQRNVGNYSASINILKTRFDEVAAELKKFNESGAASNSTIEQLQKEYGALSNIMNSQASGFVSMREEIKKNETAIEQLILLYGEDSQVVKKLIDENGKLRDSFQDLVQTQKTLGSDTFAFDGLLQGGQALVGIYSAATGAAALFGIENEDLQKSMVRLQAALAIVQGVQAAVNALQKQGAAIQLFYKVQTFLSAQAQTLFAFATGASTVALRAFRIALLATGIGAIVVLLGSFVSAMSDVADSTDNAAKSQDQLNQELDDYIARLQKVADLSEKQRNAQAGGLDSINREIQLLQAKGATEEEIFNLQQKAREKELFNLKVLQSTFIESKEKQLELSKQIADKENEIEAAKYEFTRKTNEKKQADLEKNSKANTARTKKEQKENQSQLGQSTLDFLNSRVEAAKKLTESQKQQADDDAAFLEDQNQKTVDADNALADSQIKIAAEANRKILEEDQKTADKRAEIKHRLADVEKQIAEASFDLAVSLIDGGYEKQLNAVQDLIDKLEEKRAKDIEVAKASITNQQDQAAAIAVINATADAKKKQLEQKQKEVKLKEARADRDAQALKIFGEAAVAHFKLIAELGPAGLGLAIANDVLAAIQIALLFSKPLPKYKHGRNGGPAEYAITGDGGRSEVIEYADGRAHKTPATDTLTYLPEGARVYPSVQDYIKHYAQNAIAYNMHALGIAEREGGDSYDMSNLEGKIDKLIGVIKNKPDTKVSMDYWGLHVQQKNTAGWNEYVNKYFKK